MERRESSERTILPPTKLRLALFNVEELSREKLDQVDAAGRGAHPQLEAVAQIVARIAPDILVLQEIDLPNEPPLETNARLFVDRYLRTHAPDLDYPHVFAAPTNTGQLSGLDLDGDGYTATPADRGDRRHGNDAFGFGTYSGQYAMAVLSRFPFASTETRTFQRFLWRDLPGNRMPDAFYSQAAREILRLSSKSHWDLPVDLSALTGRQGARLHLLVSHPTPPVFDGPEDRNGRRNADEIRFWALYLDGATTLVDDQGRAGGRAAGNPFAIVGDLNAHPDESEALFDGRNAIAQLLERQDLTDPAAILRSSLHDAATATFLGGVRVDYLLPSRELEIVAGGVFWPDPEVDAEGAALAEAASDHHLVWLDVVVGSEYGHR